MNDHKKSIKIDGRIVELSVSSINEKPSKDLANLLRWIADIVEKDGRIFDTINMRWM